jgi:predicted ATP-grasp superfamily ATP-dependent carboligase
MVRAIITDTQDRISLSVIRSLGEKGVYVTGVGDKQKHVLSRRGNIGARSKYCKNHLLLPSPHKNPKIFLSELLKLSKNHDVLIPITTISVDFISKHLDLFRPHIKIPIPEYKTIYQARNKELLLKLAIANKIPVPKTYFIKSLSEVKEVAKEIKYPAVVKARDEIGLGDIRYTIVNHEKELVSKYLQMHKLQDFPLIQEHIKGQGVGFFALFNKNLDPRAVFCHKRIREIPITGGPSSFCESIRDERITDYGIKLLKALNWFGVAMVEFKIDSKDNKPKLMEVNPRFWGSLPLAVASGVNFPWLLTKLAVNGDIEPVLSYKEGVKLRFLYADLIAAEQYLLSSQPNKLRFLMGFIKDLFDMHVTDGVILKDDPAPDTSLWVLYHYFKNMPFRTTRWLLSNKK